MLTFPKLNLQGLEEILSMITNYAGLVLIEVRDGSQTTYILNHQDLRFYSHNRALTPRGVSVAFPKGISGFTSDAGLPPIAKDPRELCEVFLEAEAEVNVFLAETYDDMAKQWAEYQHGTGFFSKWAKDLSPHLSWHP